MTTLLEATPYFFNSSEYVDTKAYQFKDIDVIKTNYSRDEEYWIGKHKNVWVWWELANGYAVALNENPSRGCTFPTIRIKKRQYTQ